MDVALACFKIKDVVENIFKDQIHNCYGQIADTMQY